MCIRDSLNTHHVILIFAVNSSRSFYGYARMESVPQQRLSTGHFGAMEQSFLGPCFKVRWVNCRTTPFERAENIVSAANESLPVRVARDGQELGPEAGAKLCQELDKEVFRSEKCKKVNKAKESNTENKPASNNNSLIENAIHNRKVKRGALKGAGKTKNMLAKKHKSTCPVFREAKKRKVCTEAHSNIAT
eukprot:TRINITY_DN6673_c0_g1_i19.p1 TRINITY_DN6673_c0_g1~~TRINITY_DN6673_c0_g1_i19.p1  ORF type:complete len:191 (+),score=25.63 TRINITY_DN6673_c0_g1_i19:73-645(+)